MKTTTHKQLNCRKRNNLFAYVLISCTALFGNIACSSNSGSSAGRTVAQTPTPFVSPEKITQIEIIDTQNHLATNQQLLIDNIDAAYRAWAAALNPSINYATLAKMKIRVEVLPTAAGTVDGRSASNTIVGVFDGRQILQEGATYKWLNSISLFNNQSDIIIQIDPTYLQNELWLDPQPYLRTSLVPANKIDAVSIFLHELGHALGINGFRHQETAALPVGYIGAYDKFVIFENNQFYFTGPQAVAVYGGAVPLTSHNLGHNIYHYAVDENDPLNNGLMTGINFQYGKRYSISELDIAIINDIGLL
jgi:hypothetical protein